MAVIDYDVVVVVVLVGVAGFPVGVLVRDMFIL